MTTLEQTRSVIAAHTYEPEFLGCLGEVWTTCLCGERIDATPAEGQSAAEVFRANWSAHVAAALVAADPAPAQPEWSQEAHDARLAKYDSTLDRANVEHVIARIADYPEIVAAARGLTPAQPDAALSDAEMRDIVSWKARGASYSLRAAIEHVLAARAARPVTAEGES